MRRSYTNLQWLQDAVSKHLAAYGHLSPEMQPCLLWPWGKRKGYGAVFVGGRDRSAHRVAYELIHPQIPDELEACHHCDVRACFNPSHIFSGSHCDNLTDAMTKGRMASGVRHGLHRHPDRIARGDRNGARTRPDRVARGDRHGMRKHPELVKRGEQCSWAKLSADDVVKILTLSASGRSNRSIGSEFGVSPSMVSNIKTGKSWREVVL